MPDPTKITDYVARAQADLPTQFRESAKLNALLGALVQEVQLGEDVIFDVILLRLLPAATGVNLDIIGKIVGRSRLDIADDDEYRDLLRVQIRANISDCGAEDVIYVASELTGEAVRYMQKGRAHFHLEYTGDQAIDPLQLARIQELLELVACSGVSWEMVEGDETNAFRFNTGLGFNDGELGRIVGSQS